MHTDSRLELVITGVQPCEILLNGGHFGGGLVAGDAGFQTPDDCFKVIPAALPDDGVRSVVLMTEGRPERRIRIADGEGEILRHDADDGPRLMIELNGLADEVARTTEATLPEGVAQQHIVVSARFIAADKVTAEDRGDAEGSEGISRDDAAVYLFRSAARLVEQELLVSEDPDGSERVILNAPVEEVWIRGVIGYDGRTCGVLLIQGSESHEPVGLREGQRREQNRVYQAEDGRGGADAEGEREHHAEGERGGLAELAQGEAEVGKENRREGR